MRERPKRRALTLVEVAAVCGCLTLVGSLAAPVLTRLRGDDHVVGCAQNLGTINQALGLLQQEHPGYYAPWYDDGQTSTSNGHFLRKTTWIDLLQQKDYIANRQVGYCPADRRPDPLNRQRAQAWAIMKYPVSLGGGDGIDHSYGISVPYSTHASPAQFPCWDPDGDPDRRVITGDGWWTSIPNLGGRALYGGAWNNPTWSSNMVGYRHKFAANLMHRDGHVDLVAYELDSPTPPSPSQCDRNGVNTSEHFVWHSGEHEEVLPGSNLYNSCGYQDCPQYPFGASTLNELNPNWYTQNHAWTISDIKSYKGWTCTCGGGS